MKRLNSVFNYDSDTNMTIRMRADENTNQFGRKINEMCKSFGLRICNGRKTGYTNG